MNRSLDAYARRYFETRDVCREYERDSRTTLNRFGESLGHAATLDDLHRAAYNAFADWLKSRGSVISANNRLRQLKTLWYAAFEDGLVEPPPRKLKRFKEPERIVEGWSREDFGKILAEARRLPDLWRDRVIAALWLAWNTGARRGDLFSIKRIQLDRHGKLAHAQSKTGRVIFRQLWPETIKALDYYSGPTLLNPANIEGYCRYVHRCCDRAGVPAGVFKFARRGSSSEVEKDNPGCGWKWCGHAKPGLFEKAYKVDRICGDVVPEPGRPG